MNYWSVPCVRQPLRPGQLTRIVVGVAAHDSWRGQVRYSAAERWYRRLVLAEDHEVWLLSWLPGQGTGFHDHGDSAGAFAVVQGTLRERAAAGARPSEAGRVLTQGAVRSFGPDYVHDVSNDATEPAVSIHAYSPPLAGMRRFELVGGELRQTGEEVRTW